MPKATFYNLESQKKQRLFEAALAEFSKKSFADSAISEIVRRAGISRGSFYQYFDDKLDCYLYFVGQVQSESNQLFLSCLAQEKGDLLAATRFFYQKSINSILNGPYSKFYQIMIQAHDFRLHRLLPHGNQQQLTTELYGKCDLSLLKIQKIDEFRYLVDMILNILFRSVGRYFYLQGTDYPQTITDVKNHCLLMLSWLSDGISN
jgi:AcrR family transcriptional regulator